ncbi:MAG: sulfotransferase [Halofilum sp. (in: g-proteobacteria)]
MNEPRPPVIIIGMHRSGTSVLTRLLQQAGFFMGAGASRNEEAVFTNAINSWIFRQASATWDRPESMDWLLADDALRPWMMDYISRLMNGPAAARFLGVRRWLRYRGLDRVREPWGWKDPRNTYTLPLWLELLPNARVLHIVRHGVDVAESLRSRRESAFEANIARYRRRRRFYASLPWGPKRRGFGPQVRCRTLGGGFSLWEAYVQRARDQLGTLSNPSLELSYESLLQAPHDELARAFAFCGVEPDAAALARAADALHPSRAYAYLHDPELVAFAASVEARLAHHGYAAEARARS